MHNKFEQRRTNQWPEALYSRFTQVDPRAFMAADSGVLQFSAKVSKRRHPDCGMGVFAARPIGNAAVVGGYYRLVVFADLE